MRMHRQRAPETDPAAYYHCISRVINREWVLGDAEKEELTGLLRRYEDFCGVRLVTFCLMSNHFHALVEVPGAASSAQESMSDEELLRRVRVAQMKASSLTSEGRCQTGNKVLPHRCSVP